MTVTVQLPKVAAASSPGGGGDGGSGTGFGGAGDYPYAVSASQYPPPANFTGLPNVTQVAAASFPASVATFAVLLASRLSNTSWGVYFTEAEYSPSLAYQIATNGSCGTSCGELPIAWTAPYEFGTYSSPITNLGLGVIGTTFLSAITVANETYVKESAGGFSGWTSVGEPLAGQFRSLATTSFEGVVASSTATAVLLETVGPPDNVIGLARVYPAGAGSTGIVDAAVTFGEVNGEPVEYLLLTTRGSDEVEWASSTSGRTFSTPTALATFRSTLLGGLDERLGNEPTYLVGGQAGQVGLAWEDNALFALWTTNISGATIPETSSSGNGGSTWQGPYLTTGFLGTVLDPVVVAGPDGIVHVAWKDPADSGVIVGASYSPDGPLMVPPVELPYSNASSAASGSYPALAVDALARPLVLWAGVQLFNGSSPLDYTGGYLTVTTALAVVDEGVSDPLFAADFPGASGNPPPQAAALESNVSSDIETAESDIDGGSRNDACAGQLVAGDSLYQNLTHVPLVGSATTCGAGLAPKATASSLAAVVGLDEPNVYLAVYGDWALESMGVAVRSSPLGLVPTGTTSDEIGSGKQVFPSPLSGSDSFYDQNGSGTLLGTESVTVTPTPWTATSYELPIAVSGLPTSGYTTFGGLCSRSPVIHTSTQDWAYTNATYVKVTINGTSLNATGTSAYPSAIWPYGMAPGRYSLSTTFGAEVSVVDEFHDPCAKPDTTTWHYKGWIQIELSGTLSTSGSLSINSTSGLATANYASNGSASIGVAFTTSLPSNTTTHLSSIPAGSVSLWWNATRSEGSNETTSSYYPKGDSFNVTVNATSIPGSNNPPGPVNDSISLGSNGYTISQSQTAACQFTLNGVAAEPKVWVMNGQLFTRPTNTSLQATWYSNQSDVAVLTYGPYYDENEYEVSGIRYSATTSNGSHEYVVALHGIPLGISVNGQFTVSWLSSGGSCMKDTRQSSWYSYVNGYSFSLIPADAPYDSLTHTGGGENFTWSLPTAFLHKYPGASFTNGTLYVWDLNNSSRSIVYTFTNAPTQLAGSQAYSLGTNVSLTDLGTNYTAQLLLNYTANGTVVGLLSQLANFTYEKDSSGDGLTDVEKTHGWVVPLGVNATSDATALPICSVNLSLAQSCTLDPASIVTANPDRYATNGLVSDLVEKRFDLNPNTLDTAKSQMLDTWNLTFDLGTDNPSFPKGFSYYLENSSYNFSRVCQVPTPEGNCTDRNASLGNEPTNLSCTSLHCGVDWVGDSKAWASSVLWSGSQLGVIWSFVNNTGDRLRATTGTFDRHRTMTVWGKLSWGANPLTRSTSNDSLPDGDQIDPLGAEVVQVNISSWTAKNVPSSGDGVAPYVNLRHSPSGGSAYYKGWGPSVQDSGGTTVSSSSPYVVSINVTSSSKNAYLNLSLFANTGESTVPLTGGWGGSESVGPGSSNDLLTIDLANLSGRPHAATFKWYNSTDSLTDAIYVNYSVALEHPKAPTFLVTPVNNTTLSGVPWGLKRYTGETDFDLIVLNVSNATNLTGISGANNSASSWNYSLNFAQGLNNILVPRTLFNTTPLAQALLVRNNENPSVEPWWGVSFTPDDWSGRVDGSGSDLISVFSNQSQLSDGSTNSEIYGGVPGSPGDEAGVEARQIQAVFYVNVSAVGYNDLTNETDELRDLLGGLVIGCITNTSSGVWYGNSCENGTVNTGWQVLNNVVSVTAWVGTLGLPVGVMEALANSTVLSDGGYPNPQYQQQQPTSAYGWSGFASAVWNTLSGIARATGLSIVWNWATAAAAYIGGAFDALSTALGLPRIASQFVDGIASAMEWAWNQLISTIEGGIDGLFSPIISANNQYYLGVHTAYLPAYATVETGNPVTQSQANGIWGAVSGVDLTLAETLTTALEIVLGVLSSFCLAATFLIPLILKFAIGAGMHNAPPGLSFVTLGGIQALSSAFVNATRLVAGSIGAGVAANLTAWATWAQAAGAIATITEIATIVGLGLVYRSVGLAGWVSMILAILGLFAYFYYSQHKSEKDILIYSMILSAEAVLFGGVDAMFDKDPFTQKVGYVGDACGLAGFILEAKDE